MKSIAVSNSTAHILKYLKHHHLMLYMIIQSEPNF